MWINEIMIPKRRESRCESCKSKIEVAGGEPSKTGDDRPYGRVIIISPFSPPPATLENEEEEEKKTEEKDGRDGPRQCKRAERTRALHRLGRKGNPVLSLCLTAQLWWEALWRRWKWNCPPPPYGPSTTNTNTTSQTAVNKHESKTDFYNLLRH